MYYEDREDLIDAQDAGNEYQHELAIKHLTQLYKREPTEDEIEDYLYAKRPMWY